MYVALMHDGMSTHRKFKPVLKFWIESDGKRVIGKGGAAILEQIKRDGSISRAAENLKMSYRYVWDYLDEARGAVGEPLVETFKGGKRGGGGARLTKMGEYLLSEYTRVSKRLKKLENSEVGGEFRED